MRINDVCLNTWGDCDVFEGQSKGDEEHQCFGEIIVHLDNMGEMVYDQHQGPCECGMCGEEVNALWVLTVGNYGEFIELEAVVMYPDGHARVLVL